LRTAQLAVAADVENKHAKKPSTLEQIRRGKEQIAKQPKTKDKTKKKSDPER